MSVYFQEEHFDLLEKLQNKIRNKDDQTQNLEYEKLKEANSLTKTWGEEVLKKQFPSGKLDFRNSPLDQSRKFKPYTWAKIYPEKDSPKELAFTVGIDGNLGFILKIDTVNANNKLRNRYEEIRGEFNNSPIVSMLSVEEGLGKSLDDLVAWSVEEIQKFGLTYDDLCTEIALKDDLKSNDFTAQKVLDYLKSRYPNNEQKTQKIFLCINELGKELALETGNLSTNTIRLFLKDKPPEQVIALEQCKFRGIGDSPNHNLNANTKSLRVNDSFFQISPSSLHQLQKICDWFDEFSHLDHIRSKSNKMGLGKEMPNKLIAQTLNRILFGAAGTGKTFNTINHALSIIEDKSLEELKDEKREKLKERFDEYKNQGRIKFVTFHQSFSYEDFVEGIQAETDDQGNLTYNVKSGVFKDICKNATGVSQQAESIDEIVEKFLDEITETPLELYTQQNKKFKVSYVGSGVTLQCQPLASEAKATYYANIGKIKSLLSGEQIENAYNRSYIKAVAEFLKPKVKPVQINKNDQNHVLIIDEINRGNISRIFGELITLIEDSKRAGASEELSVVLPYSKREFTVPNNLYIIGTMNSSDRSLTGLDIALRRRFTFIEMPPKPELLAKITVDEVNIQKLLTVINQRIEILLDRDHCLGHANFMSLEQQPTLDNLSNIFKQKVIPQLREYFFDDWAKINLVLNGNGMLKPKPVETSAIFPNVDSEGLGYFENKKIWELVPTSFNSIESFKKIIQHG